MILAEDWLKHNEFVCDTFIETGTNLGASLEAAAKAGYKNLISIEYEKGNFDAAKKRLESFKNVKIHHGNSPDVLEKVIKTTKKTCFWLDAHYQGGPEKEKDSKYGECPLLKELDVILSKKWKKLPIILIDDYHIFHVETRKKVYENGSNFDFTQWPTLDDILNKIGKQYDFFMQSNVLICKPNVKI